MGIWTNFKKGLKGKPQNPADIKSKEVYEKVFQKTYATERMKYMKDKAQKDAMAKARQSAPQGTANPFIQFIKGTPEQQAKAKAYLQSSSNANIKQRQKKDAEFLKQLMRS